MIINYKLSHVQQEELMMRLKYYYSETQIIKGRLETLSVHLTSRPHLHL